MKIKSLLHKYFIEIIIGLVAIISGVFLMFSTFSEHENKLFIATKAWSDFASHIPLIRSFSLGENFPPQYPLFPGEPIKYHFLFYYFVGVLEKMGLRIDIALNLLSAFGFFLLIIVIYFFAREIFKSKAVGLMSVIFFLFNSSFSFIYFFRKYPLSLDTPRQIISNPDFVSFAPYGQGIVSAFWNLNIYTNQRHLALSFALSLLLIYLLIKPVLGKKKQSTKFYILLGLLLGLSFFLHTAVFLMTLLVIFSLSALFSQIRKNGIILLVFAVLVAIPQYLYLKGTSGFSPQLVIGYLTANQFNINKFIEFWFYNLGLSLILIPLAFLKSDKTKRKIIFSFFILFITGNVVQFSTEIAANHKFFNYFLIVGNMFSAYFLTRFWNKKNIYRPIIFTLFLFMILGGIIDFFPIYNDNKVSISDYAINPDALWIKNNSSSNSVFLNTNFLYDPASLVGRKIYMGWPYFAWSQGYDTNKRGQIMKEMLGTKDKSTSCNLLKENGINFVEIKIQIPPDPNIPAISTIFEEKFTKSYQNILGNYSIYNVSNNCSNE